MSPLDSSVVGRIKPASVPVISASWREPECRRARDDRDTHGRARRVRRAERPVIDPAIETFDRPARPDGPKVAKENDGHARTEIVVKAALQVRIQQVFSRRRARTRLVKQTTERVAGHGREASLAVTKIPSLTGLRRVERHRPEPLLLLVDGPEGRRFPQLVPHGVEDAEAAGEADAEDPGKVPHRCAPQ